MIVGASASCAGTRAIIRHVGWAVIAAAQSLRSDPVARCRTFGAIKADFREAAAEMLG